MSKTSLAIYDQIGSLMLGQTLNVDVLREQHAGLTQFQFATAFWRARQRLFEERGLTLTKVRGQPLYSVDRAENMTTKVDRKRLKIVKSARQYHSALVAAQKHPELTNEERTRLNIDEVRASRSAALVEREYLLRRSR